MEKVEVVHDEELNRDWLGGWPSEVTLKTAQGAYTRRVDLPKGEPENPMSYQELKDKFTILATAGSFTRGQSRGSSRALTGLRRPAKPRRSSGF
ncbi:MAG: hypothetical protein QF659_07165 [Dehalococcoidia bacterium]|jgi:2-methylcitrate dehydratase PrpD|nr:hypothetical protein [Dehalococcoidia bacterium]